MEHIRIKEQYQKKTAVIIPCYNEEITISKVIEDFRNILPYAKIYVIDNNCTDNTVHIAKESGAAVLKEIRQGKGFVISNIVHQINTEYYIIIDGDDTYPIEYAPLMIDMLISEQADMVVGNRQSNYNQTDVRRFHGLGNKLVKFLINTIFNANRKDPLSGYRALTRKAILTLPFVVKGFDVETELTIQALYRNLTIREIQIPYRDRPLNSHSKLNTFKDGYYVLLKIIMMVLTYKPLTFFGSIGLFFLMSGLIIGTVVIGEYLTTGMVLKIPTAILTVLLVSGGFLSFISGLIIYSINHRIYETQVLILRNILILNEEKKSDLNQDAPK